MHGSYLIPGDMDGMESNETGEHARIAVPLRREEKDFRSTVALLLPSTFEEGKLSDLPPSVLLNYSSTLFCVTENRSSRKRHTQNRNDGLRTNDLKTLTILSILNTK